MIPQSRPKKTSKANQVSTIISVVVHVIIVAGLLYFAARQGYLGKQIQKISVEMVKEKKEPVKPKEPEKPKPEQPKLDQPKPEPPKYVEPAKSEAAASAAPAVAPPASDVPSFDFEGGHVVNSESDPVQLYKGYIEYQLRSQWARPENMDDDAWAAEVKLDVAKDGTLSNMQWLKGSGNDKWDQSVKNVLAIVTQIDRRPPTNFPSSVTIRFDVQEQTEPVQP